MKSAKEWAKSYRASSTLIGSSGIWEQLIQDVQHDAIDECADRAEQLLVEWQSGTASSDVRSVDPKTFGDELRRLKEEG